MDERFVLPICGTVVAAGVLAYLVTRDNAADTNASSAQTVIEKESRDDNDAAFDASRALEILTSDATNASSLREATIKLLRFKDKSVAKRVLRETEYIDDRSAALKHVVLACVARFVASRILDRGNSDPFVKRALDRCRARVVRTGDGLRIDDTYVNHGRVDDDALRDISRDSTLATETFASLRGKSLADAWSRVENRDRRSGITVTPVGGGIRARVGESAFRATRYGRHAWQGTRIGSSLLSSSNGRAAVLRSCDGAIGVAIYENEFTREIIIIDVRLCRIFIYADVTDGTYRDYHGREHAAPIKLRASLEFDANGDTRLETNDRFDSFPTFPLDVNATCRVVRLSDSFLLVESGEPTVCAPFIKNHDLDAPAERFEAELDNGSRVSFKFDADQWYASSDADTTTTFVTRAR